jgi:hypothetical protein
VKKSTRVYSSQVLLKKMSFHCSLVTLFLVPELFTKFKVIGYGDKNLLVAIVQILVLLRKFSRKIRVAPVAMSRSMRHMGSVASLARLNSTSVATSKITTRKSQLAKSALQNGRICAVFAWLIQLPCPSHCVALVSKIATPADHEIRYVQKPCPA